MQLIMIYTKRINLFVLQEGCIQTFKCQSIFSRNSKGWFTQITIKFIFQLIVECKLLHVALHCKLILTADCLV